MFEQFLSHPSVNVNEMSLLWFPVVFIFLSVHFAAAHDTVKVPHPCLCESSCPLWASAHWTSHHLHGDSPRSCSCLHLFSESRRAEGPRLWPYPQRRRPDLHVWRYFHHGQRRVRQSGRRRRTGLERKRKTERQHVRGGAGARAGLPRAGAAEPRHASGFPRGVSHLTVPTPPPPPFTLYLLELPTSPNRTPILLRQQLLPRRSSWMRGRSKRDWAALKGRKHRPQEHFILITRGGGRSQGVSKGEASKLLRDCFALQRKILSACQDRLDFVVQKEKTSSSLINQCPPKTFIPSVHLKPLGVQQLCGAESNVHRTIEEKNSSM